MKVIIICECSGIVRDAFLKCGHDAISCDLKPNFSGPHLQCDARTLDLSQYDLAICHPPCDNLSVAGNAWMKAKWRDGRVEKALDFFRWCLNVRTKRVAVENPRSIAATHIRPCDQVIQPWWFGDNFRKTTCLWLRDLPFLIPTHRRPEQIREFVNRFSPSPTRAADRARTFPGIARAMAEQWGNPTVLF